MPMTKLIDFARVTEVTRPDGLIDVFIRIPNGTRITSTTIRDIVSSGRYNINRFIIGANCDMGDPIYFNLSFVNLSVDVLVAEQEWAVVVSPQDQVPYKVEERSIVVSSDPRYWSFETNKAFYPSEFKICGGVHFTESTRGSFTVLLYDEDRKWWGREGSEYTYLADNPEDALAMAHLSLW